MSIRVMAAVWESDLPSGEKFVLLALADHARDDGSKVYPAIKTISRKTGFSRRTVQRHIHCLESKGILSAVRKDVGRTIEYFIRGDKLTPLPCQNDTRRGVKMSRGGDTVTQGGRHGDTRFILEPSNNHQREPGLKIFDEILKAYPPAGKQVGVADGQAARIFHEEIIVAEHGPLLEAAKNYAKYVDSKEIEDRFVKQIGNFLQNGYWKNFLKPMNDAPVTPDHSWRREREHDDQIMQQEAAELARRVAAGEVKLMPRPRHSFESRAAYDALVAAGTIRCVPVPVEQESL